MGLASLLHPLNCIFLQILQLYSLSNNHWLHAWKARYNISFKEVSGESKSVTPEMTASWKETSLPTIMVSWVNNK